MPARIFRSVDLPVPLPPTRPVRSSGVMSQLASSKRSFWPKRLPAAESWSISLLFSHLEDDRGFFGIWRGPETKAQRGLARMTRILLVALLYASSVLFVRY